MNESSQDRLGKYHSDRRREVDTALESMPPCIASLIRPLKVGDSLALAIQAMEYAGWEEVLVISNGRARAFILAALRYRDLAPEHHEVLNAYLVKLLASRRDAFTRSY